MTTKPKAILYLQQKNLVYYSTDRAQSTTLEFDPSCVVDLEVIDKDKLQASIDAFITNNKIVPSKFIIVLADSVIFFKDIPSIKPDEVEAETKKFLDNVPFEQVSSKKFQSEKATRVIAANTDLFIAIEDSFEKKGFVGGAVVPTIYFSKTTTMGPTLTSEQIALIMQKMDMVRSADNFFNPPKPMVQESLTTFSPKNPKKSTLPYLVPVFALLLAALGGVYYMQSQPDTQTYKAQANEQPPPPTAAPIATPTPESTTEAKLINKDVTIQIFNASGISGQAEKTKQQLTAAGFKNVTTGNAQNIVSSAKTLILFMQKVPSEVRGLLVAEMQKLTEDVSIQETTESSYDVIITIGTALSADPTITP